jgi:uncharacterized protein
MTLSRVAAYEGNSVKKQNDRPWIDTNDFSRRGAELTGGALLSRLPRLLEYLTDDEGELRWQLAGEKHMRADGGADLFLRLELNGEVSVPCTRCLQPVKARLGENRLFKLAVTESQAEREDRDADDYDVLVTSDRFDVLDLIEDEAIMALPIAPRHQDCELPADGLSPVDGASAEVSEPRENPFAVLSTLKRPDGDDAA